MSLEGRTPTEAPGPVEPGQLSAWSADGRALYVLERASARLEVFRRDLHTGRREFWREIAPADPAGVVSIGDAVIAPHGAYVYGYERLLGNLYPMQGVR